MFCFNEWKKKTVRFGIGFGKKHHESGVDLVKILTFWNLDISYSPSFPAVVVLH